MHPPFFQDEILGCVARKALCPAGAMVQRPVDLPGPVASGPNMPPFPGCPWSAESCASHDLKKITWRSGFLDTWHGVFRSHGSTPKSSILGISIINQPFWDPFPETPIFGI